MGRVKIEADLLLGDGTELGLYVRLLGFQLLLQP